MLPHHALTTRHSISTDLPDPVGGRSVARAIWRRGPRPPRHGLQCCAPIRRRGADEVARRRVRALRAHRLRYHRRGSECLFRNGSRNRFRVSAGQVNHRGCRVGPGRDQAWNEPAELGRKDRHLGEPSTGGQFGLCVECPGPTYGVGGLRKEPTQCRGGPGSPHRATRRPPNNRPWAYTGNAITAALGGRRSVSA
jgi:hypothetical protein